MFKIKKEQPIKIKSRKREDKDIMKQLLPPTKEEIQRQQKEEDDKIESFLLEEEEEEEEDSLDPKAYTSIEDSEEEEEPFKIPRISYNKKYQIFDFKYNGLPVTVKNEYSDYTVQICQAKISYKKIMQFLSFLDPNFVSIIEYIKTHYKHIIDYQDKNYESNMQIFEKISEVEQKIENIDTNVEKYPHFNRFFQVPKTEQIFIQDKNKEKEKQKLKQEVNDIKQRYKSKSKFKRSRNKINHKKK